MHVCGSWTSQMELEHSFPFAPSSSREGLPERLLIWGLKDTVFITEEASTQHKCEKLMMAL